MWYVLRFVEDGRLRGIIVSEGSNKDEALENAKKQMDTPAGTVFGMPFFGEPPPDLCYRIIDKTDPAMDVLMRNAAMPKLVSQWFWIRFVAEDGTENGVAISNGPTLTDALERLGTHTTIPPGEPEGYPLPAPPPEHLHYRIISNEEAAQLSGGFAPGIGGWVSSILKQVQGHDISALPNAGTLQQMLNRINKFRKE